MNIIPFPPRPRRGSLLTGDPGGPPNYVEADVSRPNPLNASSEPWEAFCADLKRVFSEDQGNGQD